MKGFYVDEENSYMCAFKVKNFYTSEKNKTTSAEKHKLVFCEYIELNNL